MNQIERYYRFHSKIYDITRWVFLFGRSVLIKDVARYKRPTNILEVGCGTGANLIRLARTFPDAALCGLDISESMLSIARRKCDSRFYRIKLLHTAYNEPLKLEQPYDLILFSYSLSMMNPGWDDAISSAYEDLASGGYVAVVDFHRSSASAFKRWMALNHVRLDGHLLARLDEIFGRQQVEIHQVFGTLWSYFTFIGSR